MTADPFAAMKAAQRESWGLFSPLAVFTTPAAAHLVRYAGVQPGQHVLDLACGTGVVALTAHAVGARVRGLDLSPALLEEARRNAAIADAGIEFTEGDAENLPYPDASFDVVLSQFGHMFAPRPQMVVAEMLRVLKPGGRIAFSTWSPELVIGRLFDLVATHVPAPPGAAAPTAWGRPEVVRERLGEAVRELEFSSGDMVNPALSPRHFRAKMELTAAPFIKAVQVLSDQPERLARFRSEIETIVTGYFADNCVRQTFLMTRALKR